MTGPLDSVAGRTFLELLRTAGESIFRLETLQLYGGSGEDEALRAFTDGLPQPPLSGDDRAYLDTVRAARARGARWERVHVVREPLTTYLRFELTWEYAPNVDAGELIGIVPVEAGSTWSSEWATHDFWLVDDRRLFLPRYDDEGVWLGLDEVDEREAISGARRAKSIALRASEPWYRYLARHPDLSSRLTDGARRS